MTGIEPNIFYNSLKPYVSLTMGRVRKLNAAEALEQAKGDIEAILTNQYRTSAVQSWPILGKAGCQLAALSYIRDVAPSWTDHSELLDRQHHLVLFVFRKRCLAIAATDPKLKGPIASQLFGDPGDIGLSSWLEPISRKVLAAAFLTGGQAKTLWLSGIHRRSVTKADAKTLAGMDLDYSLDPFDDQSFFWSAARSRNVDMALTVGASPRSSRVWTGPSQSIKGFAQTAASLIDAIVDSKVGDEPFRFLATPSESLDPAKVKNGYELSILPPNMLDDGEEDADAVNADIDLILSSNVVAQKGQDASLDLTIEHHGEPIGSFTLEVTVGSDGKAKLKAVDTQCLDNERSEEFNRMRTLIANGTGVNIRYDSGHSIMDRQVFIVRPPSVPFEHFEPRDFSGFNLKKEKPSDLTKIGQEKSLFCWVQRTHSGWLACDDGANEKADFIHLDDTSDPPTLSLIHVKAAKSKSENRRVSVAAYEVVAAQAIKNLQWLDRESLVNGLRQSARAANHWWFDGQSTKKDDFVAAIEALGDNFQRKVVIVQPHVTTKAHKRAKEAISGVNKLGFNQLNTLLASAWRSCNGLGAEFLVIWSD